MNGKYRRWCHLVALILIGFFIAACEGDDGAAGAAGAAGPAGATGADGPAGPPGTGLDPLEAAKVEACATCHGDVGEEKHQSEYDKYVDASTLALTINNVTSVADGAGTFTVTVDFSITDNGMPLIEGPGLASMDQKRFYAVQYDSATGQYLNSTSLHQITSGSFTNVVAGAAPGDYVLTRTTRPYAPETPLAPFDGAQVYGYIARGALLEHAGDAGSELPSGTHVHLYDDVSNTAMAFGTAAAADPNSYVSAANVAGCEKCHGTPYMKHGYRNPIVAGLPDFGSCKSCHYDDRNGGHRDWQYMVDQPFNWATGVALAAGEYDYKAKLMNDVHMAHAMEFPFPQSMANCATCHEGKLTQILDNSNFVPETCLSCHPVKGTDAWPETATADEGVYHQGHRAPPFEYLWAELGVEGFHDVVATPNCQACHGAGVAPPFNQLHSGYDEHISDDTGQRYADLFTVSIDQVTRSGDLLTVNFSSNDAAIVPELLVSFYGWDSKHYLVGGHERDANPACQGFRPGCNMEYVPESSGGSANPLFTEDAASVPGNWMVTADMAAWQLTKTDTIPVLIANGDVRKAEIILLPELDVGGEEVALNAVSKTFDLGTGAFVADYFHGANATVDMEKCNVCHDQLATTFHANSGRGGGGVQVCKNCHTTTFPGSHVEMGSRSIENYVHSIHSFQDFDIGDTFEIFDPVLAKRYDQHINHVFPNFTIRNCEACHLEGTFDVPDQSQSMPGVLAASDDVATWYVIVGGLAIEDPSGRNIGTVPEVVTGPASRACGACHRSRLINRDLAGDLAAFNAHTEAGGTFVENDAEDTVLFDIIYKIMSMFE